MRILREEIYLTIDYTLQYLRQNGFWNGKLLPSELFKLIVKEYQVKQSKCIIEIMVLIKFFETNLKKYQPQFFHCKL